MRFYWLINFLLMIVNQENDDRKRMKEGIITYIADSGMDDMDLSFF